MADPTYCQASINEFGSEIAFSEKNFADKVFATRLEGVTDWPHKIEFREHSYRLNNYTGDTLSEWQERAVTVAFRMIQMRITKASFRRERNRDVKVDIDVSFEPEDHFSSKFVLAHDYFPNQGDISSDCHINDDWNWVPTVHMADAAHPPLIPILGHEFLHGMGFGHDTLPESMGKELMYPSFNLGDPINRLGPRDLSRLQGDFGEKKRPNWVWRYFVTRRNQGWDFY